MTFASSLLGTGGLCPTFLQKKVPIQVGLLRRGLSFEDFLVDFWMIFFCMGRVLVECQKIYFIVDFVHLPSPRAVWLVSMRRMRRGCNFGIHLPRSMWPKYSPFLRQAPGGLERGSAAWGTHFMSRLWKFSRWGRRWRVTEEETNGTAAQAGVQITNSQGQQGLNQDQGSGKSEHLPWFNFCRAVFRDTP